MAKPRLRNFFLIIAAFWPLSSVANEATDAFMRPSASYVEAYKLYRQGDAEAAIRIWELHAEKNDLHSLLALTIMHARGDNLEWDYRRADAWLGRAMSLGKAESAFIAEYLYLQWQATNDYDIGWLLSSVYRRGEGSILNLPENEDSERVLLIRRALHKKGQRSSRSPKFYYLRWIAYLSSLGHKESVYEWYKAKEVAGIGKTKANTLKQNFLKGHLPSAEQLFRTARQALDKGSKQGTSLMVDACAAKIAADSFGRDLLVRGECSDRVFYSRAKAKARSYAVIIGRLKRVYNGEIPIDVLTDVASTL